MKKCWLYFFGVLFLNNAVWAGLPSLYVCKAAITKADQLYSTADQMEGSAYRLDSLPHAIAGSFHSIGLGSLHLICEVDIDHDLVGFPSSQSWVIGDETDRFIYICAYACKKYQILNEEQITEIALQKLKNWLLPDLEVPMFTFPFLK